MIGPQDQGTYDTFWKRFSDFIFCHQVMSNTKKK